MTLSVLALKPAPASLKAINVPENPTTVKAAELLAVKEKLFKMLARAVAVKLAAVPEDEFKVTPVPGRSITSPVT